MPTSLQGIAQKAKSQKQYRFRNLYGMLNEDVLRDCWRTIRKNAAYGVDRVSAQAYAQQPGGQHQAPGGASQEQELPGQTRQTTLYSERGWHSCRPLGIPVVEDKLLQLAVTRLLDSHLRAGFPAL